MDVPARMVPTEPAQSTDPKVVLLVVAGLVAVALVSMGASVGLALAGKADQAVIAVILGQGSTAIGALGALLASTRTRA